MSTQPNDIEALHHFAAAVMMPDGSHADRAIFLTMLGGIIWRVEGGSIKIRFRDSDSADSFLRWVSITGYEYACTHNRETNQIEIHDHNGRGLILHTISNATPIAEVERIFSTL